MFGTGDNNGHDTSERRVQGLLHLIRQTHAEHDARIAMTNAIHQAEVVVIGRGDHSLGGRVAARILIVGGHLAARIGPATRFAVRAELATVVDIDAASKQGVAVIDERELDRMIDIYTIYSGREQVRAAARRALEANRVASTRPIGNVVTAPSPISRRMATTRDEAARRKGVQELPEPVSEDEQELERHARNVRGLNASTPFRYQRQPLLEK
ncbi:MAG: hypothetical protein ABI317_08345 [Gaiellales bacterium]